MRILLCGDSLDVGGAETHVLELARELAALGHSVTVAADYGRMCPSLFTASGDITFIKLPFAKNSVSAFIRLIKLINDGDFNVVHAHSRRSAFAVEAVRRMLPTRRFGFAVTSHAHYADHPLKDRLSVWGDACIAVSEDIRRRLTDGFGLASEKITVIPNGIDTNRFYPRESVSNGTFNIVFASRMDSDCSLGATLLCRIAPVLKRHIHSLRITLIGGGERLNYVRRLASEANGRIGEKCIVTTGAAVDMPEHIAKSDLAVGVSRFALEALAMGKNVILFGNEGALGIFDKSRLSLASATNFTARGCSSPTASLLLNEILKAYRLSRSRRKELSEFGRRVVLEGYSSKAVAERTEKLYRSITPPLRIALGGYYGFGNLGDETVGAILRASLKERLPFAEIKTLTASPVNFNAEVNRFSPLAVTRALLNSDIYLSGGGSLLQNSTSFRSLAYYCALISAARLLGCRVIIASNGLGPLEGRVARTMARAALMKADYISLRDEYSSDLARRLTDGRKFVHLSADPAFSIEPTQKADGNAVAYSFRASEASSPTLSAALDLLCRDLNASHLPIPMDSRLDASAEFSVNDADGILSKMKHCRAAVGSRLHFLIFAILSGIPIAPVGNDPKLNALSMMTLGLPSIDPSLFPSPRELERKIVFYLKTPFSRDRFIGTERRLFYRDMDRIAAFCKKISQSH